MSSVVAGLGVTNPDRTKYTFVGYYRYHDTVGGSRETHHIPVWATATTYAEAEAQLGAWRANRTFTNIEVSKHPYRIDRDDPAEIFDFGSNYAS